MRALSIRQPWAWLIVQGHKRVENREWRTNYRGPLLIHAAKVAAKGYFQEVAEMVEQEFGITVPARDQIELGGVVGMASLTDCVSELDDPWFTGPHGLLLSGARPLPFHACKGALGFFHVPASAMGLQVEFGEC
jgi:hypothetical protein